MMKTDNTEFDTGYKMGVKESLGEIEKLRKQLKEAKKVIEFYGDTTDYTDRGYHGVWCGHADDYSDAMQRLINDDGKTAREYLKKYRGDK